MKGRRLLSVLLALALVIGAMVPLAGTVRADMTGYEALVHWAFDGSDAYSASWSKGGYTSSGVTPTYTTVDGRLQVVEDYTGSSNATYNRVMALYSFGSGANQKDLSKAVKLTFTYYCKTGDQTPSQFIAVYTGMLEGAASNTTVSETWKFADAAKKQDTSDLEGYDMYLVSVTTGTSTQEQRSAITRWQLGEIRTNNTYQGTVYYDDIVFWKEQENLPSVTVDKSAAIYGQPITATAENIEGTLNWQWYSAAAFDLSDARPIEGAVSAAYTPALKYAGGWIYCVVDNGLAQYQTDAVRVAAAETPVQTQIPFTETAVNQYNQYFLTNTKAYYGKFDTARLVSGGYFQVNYSGVAGTPQFQWATWSSTTGKASVQVAPIATGMNEDGTMWARYSYESLVTAWGDEDFSELKALRLYYKADDSAELKVHSVSWFGMPMSYGELGEPVEIKGSYTSHHYLFTRHVGGTFDATRIREDSLFYVEYQGDENALNMVLQSHSNKNATYVTVAPVETGETGMGWYSVFSGKALAEAFGDDLRYVDGMRLTLAADKSLTANASLYFFEGSGSLLDDISADGYEDAILVPWTKYDHTDKTGIAVIGASITQNPLVTAAALEGAPYYAPNGGWNVILDRTDVVTYGIGSQTTVNIAERFDEVLRYNYDTIIIQCGNNDLGAFSDESKVIAQEVNSYTVMFEKVKEKNAQRAELGMDPIRVYVIAINPTNSEGYSNTMQSRIEHVVEALAELSESYEFVTYIKELHEAFKNQDSQGNYVTGSPNDPECTEVHVNPALVMSDGLHPVAEGYALYAKYLKPLLASADPADTRLVSLSYRMSQTQKKTPVTGFETLKTADSYEVLLPAGTAADGQVQLYVTAANLSSTVLVNGNAVASDEYGNDQITLTLVGGEATAAVEVTAPNGTKKVYNVTFRVNTDATVFESEDSYEITVTDGTVDSWPYIQIPVSVSLVNPGTTVEFDLAVDNLEFTKMYLETDLDWVMMGSRNMKPEDFEENVAHITMLYVGASPIAIGNLQIKTGGSDITDFRGTLTVSELKITNDLTYVDEDPSDDPIPDRPLVQTVLSDTQASGEGAWALIQTVQTSSANGTFDASSITKDGYFTVTYTGTEGAVYLALAEWTTGAWISVNTPTSTTVAEDGSFVSTFAFDDLQTALNVFNTSNSTDVEFEDIDAISVGAANAEGTTVVTEISWYGYPTVIELGETQMLFEGSKTASVPGTNLTFFYTSHVGGSWDAAAINEGSYIYVEYTGAREGVYLAFASASGATGWVAVYPDETGVNGSGRYYSIFSYDNFAQAFGTNFARLDQIQAYCHNKGEVTLKRIAYFAGEGAPVDNSDGTWDRPETGIAFIGDSIVQNPLVDTAHLNGIDWNGILGRTDCVNYGIGGQTTKECAARIEELAKKNYSKVVMLCGINDIGRGMTNEQILANYNTMFETLKSANPDIQILLISVLPTTTAFYKDSQDKIVALNAELQAMAEATPSVTFVDCYSAFVGEDGYCMEGITFDGLHPNLDGYGILAEILKPYLENREHPFTDVVYNDRFYDAIVWAYKEGITSGTGDGTTFSPEDPCTRKQIVTFLWRAAGEPEPKSMKNPFTDVKADRFEKAILWAYYEGITTGTGDGTTFSPENICTRKQIVTFLWRYHGEPKPASMENKFVDVKNDRFAPAILWAAEQGITTGTGDGTTFSPESPCTRKQIVTFLFRYMIK